MNNDAIMTQNKESWLRYGFWVIAVALAAFAIWFFINMFNHKLAAVPDGYKFSIEDHYAANTATWVTYYIYDTYVLVRNDDPDSNGSSPAIIYDGVDTSKLTLDENDTTKACDSDSCYEYPKVLSSVKQSIVGKAWREYTGR